MRTRCSKPFSSLSDCTDGSLDGKPLEGMRRYVSDAPCSQHCVDLFAGEWSSRFPEKVRVRSGGHAGLFEDERIEWAKDRWAEMGRVLRGAKVLELGPLEAGHSTMLEQFGAAEITAVEANRRSFLKCLVVKEIMRLRHTRFLLGEAVAFLEQVSSRYDFALVSGFLYHMLEPVRLLELLSRSCRALYVWTHYFDVDKMSLPFEMKSRFGAPARRSHAGFEHTVYPYRYEEARDWDGFCGGPKADCVWLNREGVLGALAHFGYDRIEVREESNLHGPALSIVAAQSGWDG